MIRTFSVTWRLGPLREEELTNVGPWVSKDNVFFWGGGGKALDVTRWGTQEVAKRDNTSTEKKNWHEIVAIKTFKRRVLGILLCVYLQYDCFVPK